MTVSAPIPIAPSVVPSFLGSGHTCVSCPHQGQLYLHNTLLPKNDCPNMVSSSDAETSETASSTSVLSTSPSGLISTILAVSVPPDAHGPAEHSTLPLRTQHNYRWPVLLTQQPLLLHLAKSETCTLEPIQCGTGNAIPCVITYETGCSLFPPFHSKLRQQLVEKDSSERLNQPYPFGTGVASPHDHTRRVWFSTL